MLFRVWGLEFRCLCVVCGLVDVLLIRILNLVLLEGVIGSCTSFSPARGLFWGFSA